MQVPEARDAAKIRSPKSDAAMRAKLKQLVRHTTADIEKFRFHHAAERLYHFFWHCYADKVIEELKPRLAGERGSAEKKAAQALLLEFHTTLIRLLHPFMPFITEEVWQHLPIKNKKLLMVEQWPQ